jgi:hypothetical protein
MSAQKKVVVLQSNYLPWKGYFDLIQRADVFIFYDDVQFTKNDWRNRNKIKTPRGPEWISIPCGTDLKRTIKEVTITDRHWQEDHWNRICINYKQAPYFHFYKDFFHDFYLNRTWDNLSNLNRYLIEAIAHQFLGLTTRFEDSADYDPVGERVTRLIDLLKKAGATEYISGPSAKNYIPEDVFARESIQLTWMDYAAYPPYRQQFPPFIHDVSIIDLLFNEGPQSIHYIAHGPQSELP